jgi:hypothetical protein
MLRSISGRRYAVNIPARDDQGYVKVGEGKEERE